MEYYESEDNNKSLIFRNKI